MRTARYPPISCNYRRRFQAHCLHARLPPKALHALCGPRSTEAGPAKADTIRAQKLDCFIGRLCGLQRQTACGRVDGRLRARTDASWPQEIPLNVSPQLARKATEGMRSNMAGKGATAPLQWRKRIMQGGRAYTDSAGCFFRLRPHMRARFLFRIATHQTVVVTGVAQTSSQSRTSAASPCFGQERAQTGVLSKWLRQGVPVCGSTVA